LSFGGWDDPEVIVGLAGVFVAIALAIGGRWARVRSKKSAQAALVTAWSERLADGRAVVNVQNGSHEPIHDILIQVTRPSGRKTPSSERPEIPSREISMQVLAASTIAPHRTVSFPVEVSRLGSAVRPDFVMHFKDVADRSWIRDGRGRMMRHSDDRLRAGLFGGSVVTGQAEQTSLDGTAGDPRSPIPPMAYSTIAMSAAGGSELTITLLPEYAEVEVEAFAEMTIDGQLKATVRLDQDARLLGLTFHNVPSNRAAAKHFRMEYMDVFDNLLIVFREGSGAEQLLEGAEQVLPIPLPRGGTAGEILYDGAGQPLVVRVLEASRRMHPEFWRARKDAARS